MSLKNILTPVPQGGSFSIYYLAIRQHLIIFHTYMHMPLRGMQISVNLDKFWLCNTILLWQIKFQNFQFVRTPGGGSQSMIYVYVSSYRTLAGGGGTGGAR